MATQKWRNPYSTISKKSVPKANKAALTSTASTAQAAPPVIPSVRSPALPPLLGGGLQHADLRASVTRMRNNLKGISTTIRQMEDTMNTLHGAMDLLDSLGRPRNKSPENADAETQQESEDGIGNLLGNIDVIQVLSLLQSPLVQGLLQNQLGGSARKKEG